MNLKDLAKKIPAKYRAQVLDTNAIFKAIALPHDPHMYILFTVWKNFVDPENRDLDLNCTLCLSQMLEDYKRIQPLLLELHRQDQLLGL